jgi:hypothetical protein
MVKVEIESHQIFVHVKTRKVLIHFMLIDESLCKNINCLYLYFALK